MHIIDTALRKRQEEGRPIRVGMIGCGFMGSGIVLQVATAVPGMEIVAIAARKPDQESSLGPSGPVNSDPLTGVLPAIESASMSC
jgi:predicted homoserine dehydrogenase-like protein